MRGSLGVKQYLLSCHVFYVYNHIDNIENKNAPGTNKLKRNRFSTSSERIVEYANFEHIVKFTSLGDVWSVTNVECSSLVEW